MNTTDLYIITNLTNLHVGSGDANFGTIDNLVQRDPVTDFPLIHSSSLKGAFREYFMKDTQDNETPLTRFIFGSHHKSNEKQQGAYNFFEAELIVFPVRSNAKPFFRATCPAAIKSLLSKLDLFCPKSSDSKNYKALDALSKLTFKEDKPLIFVDLQKVILEKYDAVSKTDFAEKKTCTNILGENLALFPDKLFKSLVGVNALPVIARNQLENGESKNLWYEEVVPRESKFFTFIARPETNTEFDNNVNGKVVQIGANATIGYGFCEIQKIDLGKEVDNSNV